MTQQMKEQRDSEAAAKAAAQVAIEDNFDDDFDGECDSTAAGATAPRWPSGTYDETNNAANDIVTELCDKAVIYGVFAPVLNSKSGRYTYTLNARKFAILILKHVCVLTIEDTNKERSAGGDNMLILYAGGRYVSVTRRMLSHLVSGIVEAATRRVDALRDISLSTRQLADVVAQIEFLSSIFPYDALDSDEYAVCLRDGVLDLRTMTLMPHDVRRLLTRRLEVDWADRNTPTPVFDKYISDLAHGDEETIKFLKTWAGICMSSLFVYKYKTSLLLVGLAHAGKSQYIDFLEWLIGEANCATVDPAKLSKNDHAAAKLKGKRLMVTPELSSVKLDDMSKIKTLLGGDRFDCDAKYFAATDDRFKGGAVLVGNDYVKIGGKEASAPQVIERFVPVWCDNVLPPGQRDQGLQEKMRKEAAGIVYQCLTLAHETLAGDAFDKRVLPIPAKSIANRESMAVGNDPVLEFKQDALICTSCAAVASVPFVRLYEIFSAWFRANHDAKYTTKRDDFRDRLQKLGVTIKTKRGGGLVVAGYQMNEDFYNGLVEEHAILRKDTDAAFLVPDPNAAVDLDSSDTLTVPVTAIMHSVLRLYTSTGVMIEASDICALIGRPRSDKDTVQISRDSVRSLCDKYATASGVSRDAFARNVERAFRIRLS